MNKSRFLIVACVTVTFAVTAVAFRVSAPKTSMSALSRAGTLAAGEPMLEPRSGHAATLLPNGKVLITGGMRRNQDLYKSAELYDPASGKFRSAGDMTVGRVGHIALLLESGKVLIAGGWINRGATDSAELYDPASGKFSGIAPMTTRRGRPSATVLENGDVLIAGGEDHDGPDATLSSAEIFHATTLRFEPVGSMHHPRISHTAVLLRDGRVLVAGGFATDVTPGAEIFDPKTGKFTETGSLSTARCKHTAGLLPDGRVLIAGGASDRSWNSNLNSAEIYDPKTGKFTPVASLNDKRFKLPDEAVRLASGQLLIAGGSKQVEVFDPASGKFLVSAGQMNDNWHYMSETRLSDGSVLLAGGYPNSDQATAQTWIFRP